MGKRVNTVPGIDKSWQAESDARTLAEAHTIHHDPKRLKSAAEHAKVMHAKVLEDAKSLKKVANKAPKSGKK